MRQRVTEIWRYPVKSFQGEPLEAAGIGPTGIEGDRRYGVRSVESGRILSAKTEGTLLDATARTEADTVVLALPGGLEVACDDPSVHGQLTEWLGRPVELAVAGEAGEGSGSQAAYEMFFDATGGFDLSESPASTSRPVDIPMMPDRFVDLAHLNILTAGSIETCREAAPDLDWDVRRFRPNVFTAGERDDSDPAFPEDAWVGGEIRIGAGPRIAVDLRAIRCVVPLRPQPGMPRCREIHGVLSRLHDYHLGVYCRVVEPGRIAVGDAVEVL
ncbi:MAG: MOSC N-terminal beta barrel domain-containing protein [Acidimicrobiia bacterium]|nr:MOSC N-terminal beta barrel domain-containing protein [Acidimicrobiia bacterium]